MSPVLVVLRALGLGDFLTAVPALRALAAAYPRHRRVLAMPRALAPLARISATADDVVDAAPLAPLDRRLARADLAVNLHGCGPQSHRLLLALEPRRLIAFAHPAVPETAGMPTWRSDEHEVMRWCRLLQEHGVDADPSCLALDVPSAAVGRGATLLHPGAASPARRWPIERWVTVARAERQSGRDVILTGGVGEIALTHAIARQAGIPAECVYAGRTNVVMLAGLVAAAGRVVCGDTGVAHLATAVGTPSVLLFGPTSPARWGPPPDRSQHRVLWVGRTGDPHGTAPDPGLLAIRSEDVLAALAR